MKPSRRARRDARRFVFSLARLYPCEECSRHFVEHLRAAPPEVGSRHEFEQWACRTHNSVNRALRKPVFDCRQVRSRWGELGCEADGSAEGAACRRGAY